jgi:hypothetical protein
LEAVIMTMKLRHVELYLSDDTMDADELAHRAYGLRRELLELGVDSVEPLKLEAPPSESKTGDPIAVGALIVGLVSSPSLIAALAGTIQSWMTRNASQRIRIKVGDKELEVAGPLSAADTELIREFISRYFNGGSD